MQSNEAKCFGSIPWPHQVHSIAFFAAASSGWGKGVDPKLFVSSCTTCRWGEDLGKCFT